MKFVVLFFSILFGYLFSPIQDSEKNYLKPDKTYENKTHTVVYLILELPASKKFENRSEYDFRIVKQNEIGRFTFQKHLQGKIDVFESSMTKTEKKLKDLNKN